MVSTSKPTFLTGTFHRLLRDTRETEGGGGGVLQERHHEQVKGGPRDSRVSRQKSASLKLGRRAKERTLIRVFVEDATRV